MNDLEMVKQAIDASIQRGGFSRPDIILIDNALKALEARIKTIEEVEKLKSK